MSERCATRQTRSAGRRGVEGSKIERLVHARVGEAPDERGRREISRHDDDCVGEGGRDQMMRNREIRGRSDPPRPRPDEGRDQASDNGEKHSGAGAAQGPHARKLRSAVGAEGSLREMPDRLAAQGISRLNAKRVERPEILLGRAEQRTPAEPARKRHAEQHERGADSGQFEKPGKDVANPCRRHQRRYSQNRRRRHDRRDPREHEFRQADLGQEAAGDREQRLLLRARGVVFGVAVARIEDRAPGNRRAALKPGSGARGEDVGRSHGLSGNGIFPEASRRHSTPRFRR